jgi:hypothetical protein
MMLVGRIGLVCSAVLTLVIATAGPAAAATQMSGSISGGSGTATVTARQINATFSIQACDTLADGHHVEAWLFRKKTNEIGTTVLLGKAKAFGGNGTCSGISGTVSCGTLWDYHLEVYVMEGSTILRGTTSENGIGPACLV